jgi:hypothetical protein
MLSTQRGVGGMMRYSLSFFNVKGLASRSSILSGTNCGTQGQRLAVWTKPGVLECLDFTRCKLLFAAPKKTMVETMMILQSGGARADS